MKQPYGKDQQRFLDCFPLQALILVYGRHKLLGYSWMGFWKGEGKEVENFGVVVFGQGSILGCVGFIFALHEFIPSFLALFPNLTPQFEFPSLS